jgi:hypothetical protein
LRLVPAPRVPPARDTLFFASVRRRDCAYPLRRGNRRNRTPTAHPCSRKS